MSNSQNNPPSFAPKNRPARPKAEGAKRIGTPDPAEPYRVPRRVSYTQQPSIERSSQQPSSERLSSSQRASESRLRSHVPPLSAQPPSYQPARPLPQSAPVQRTPRHAPLIPQEGAQPYTAQRQQDASQRTNNQINSQINKPHASRARQRTIKRRAILTMTAVLAAIIILPLAWGLHLYNYGNDNLAHIDALSGAPDTPGTTYLIVGSDEREPGSADTTQGMRADTIMLLHKPDSSSGRPALVSLPRDSWVEIPDNGEAKINAAFSWGGPELLVKTVENLTGFTIDHYVQIGMNGVKNLADAVGGVNLCLDYAVNDPESQLVWPPVEGAEPGCFDVNGDQALAFSRMRKADPLGDIGRTNRQRQVVGAILHKALTKEILLSPSKQKNLVGNTAQALTVDTDDSIANVGFAGLALRDVMGEGGLLGAPPIADMAYWTDDGQSAVLLDPDKIDEFWAKMAEGTLSADDFYNPQL